MPARPRRFANAIMAVPSRYLILTIANFVIIVNATATTATTRKTNYPFLFSLEPWNDFILYWPSSSPFRFAQGGIVFSPADRQIKGARRRFFPFFPSFIENSPSTFLFGTCGYTTCGRESI
jgi:hypothetical protein